MTGSSSPLRVAVVGVGHLGKEHARVYAESEKTQLMGVVDRDPERGSQVAARHSVPFLEQVHPLLEQVWTSQAEPTEWAFGPTGDRSGN